MSTGFATRAYTDTAKNIMLKSLVINKNKESIIPWPCHSKDMVKFKRERQWNRLAMIKAKRGSVTNWVRIYHWYTKGYKLPIRLPRIPLLLMTTSLLLCFWFCNYVLFVSSVDKDGRSRTHLRDVIHLLIEGESTKTQKVKEEPHIRT